MSDSLSGLHGKWTESMRYPDPSIRAMDKRFAKYHLPLSSVQRLYVGTQWGEGPVYLGDQRCLIWSDVSGNRVLRWDEITGQVTDIRKPSNNANGHTRDRQGRVILPTHLLHYAKLGREVVVIGIHDHLEIWDRAAWRAELERFEGSAKDVAERLAAQHD